jgi:hypothetical protein
MKRLIRGIIRVKGYHINLIYSNVQILEKGTLRNWENALSFLMRLFHQQTGKRVMVLLDEYDAPIHAGQEHNLL